MILEGSVIIIIFMKYNSREEAKNVMIEDPVWHEIWNNNQNIELYPNYLYSGNNSANLSPLD